MRCEDVRPLLEDYFDSELDERTNSLVNQHLGLCAICAGLYQKLEGEQALYLRYECDAEPAPAFWENVMARASEENVARPVGVLSTLRGWFRGALGSFNAPRLSPSLTALIVVVAITSTIFVMRYTNSREVTNGPVVSLSQKEAAPAIASTPQADETGGRDVSPKEDGERVQGSEQDEDAQPQLVKNSVVRKPRTVLVANRGNVGGTNPGSPTLPREPSSDELVREAEQKYVEAIAMLSRDVKRRRSRLDAETAARFERTLTAVDRTIADTRRAARRHPGDPVAAKYMLTAYARKVDVLREMVDY